MPLALNSRAYEEEAAKLLGEMELALEELAQDPEDVEYACMAYRALHTLAGASSMFGYVSLAEAATQVETDYLRADPGKRPISVEVLALMRGACARMRAILEEGPQGPGGFPLAADACRPVT